MNVAPGPQTDAPPSVETLRPGATPNQVPGRQRPQEPVPPMVGGQHGGPPAKAAHDPSLSGEADLRPGTIPTGLEPCNGPTCTALIRWVITLANARMPLEPDPHPDGNVIRVRLEDGSIRARVLTGNELPAQQTAWMPHWRNCPDSPEFRKRKARTGPRCKACEQPMDPDLARLERWTTHPACDPAGVVPTRERRSA